MSSRLSSVDRFGTSLLESKREWSRLIVFEWTTFCWYWGLLVELTWDDSVKVVVEGKCSLEIRLTRVWCICCLFGFVCCVPISLF